jgi:hypothetical protein
MEALVDQRMMGWKQLENQRTDVATSVWLMTRENLTEICGERVFPKFKFIFRNNLGQW